MFAPIRSTAVAVKLSRLFVHLILFGGWSCATALAQAPAPPPPTTNEPEAKQGERQPARQADPEKLTELLVAGAKVHPGSGEPIYVRNPKGKPIIGKLHCEVGDHRMVLLPSGALDLVKYEDTRPAPGKTFVPATAEQIIAELRAEGFDKYKTMKTDRYLYVYDCSEHFFKTTTGILETLYPGVIEKLKSWGLTPVDPAVPMVVMMVPNREAFDAIQPMPREVAAYYSGITNRIVLYEDPQLSDRVPEYALKEASYTVAHEGVHQILHNTGIQQRLSRWPMWVSEGLPEYFCPIKIGQTTVKEGGAVLPKRDLKWTSAGLMNDLRMWALTKMASDDGTLLAATVHSPQLDADGYAVAWGLTHYLIEKARRSFVEYLKEISQMQPLQPPKAGDEVFAKHFGGDMRTLEGDVRGYLTSAAVQKNYKDPIIFQTHYVVVHTVKRGKKFEVTMALSLSPAAAREWKESQEKTADAAQTGTTHSFRTEICKSRIEAMRIWEKIGR